MEYSKSNMHVDGFAANVFKKFTDAVSTSGDPIELSQMLHNRFTVDDFAYHDDMYYFGIMKYFNEVVIPHKIAVYEAGMDIDEKLLSSNLLSQSERQEFHTNLWIHDLSKFSAKEAFGYAMYNRKTGHGKEEFELAWHHHKMNNPHHPEYWLNPNRSGELEALPMPQIYICEMVADWMGASKVYGGTMEKWLPENLPKFKFANPTKVGLTISAITGMNIKNEDGCLTVE